MLQTCRSHRRSCRGFFVLLPCLLIVSSGVGFYDIPDVYEQKGRLIFTYSRRIQIETDVALSYCFEQVQDFNGCIIRRLGQNACTAAALHAYGHRKTSGFVQCALAQLVE